MERDSEQSGNCGYLNWEVRRQTKDIIIYALAMQLMDPFLLF